MNRRYFVVDAFAAERFTGNAAAVLLDAEGLDERRMRAIAAEFNLSETTFVLPPIEKERADVRFRWFTPTVEVAMCGHATLAGVHALAESGRLELLVRPSGDPLRIETKSGVLTAFVESSPGPAPLPMIWLEMIPPKLIEDRRIGEELTSSLGLSADPMDSSLPPTRTQDDDVLLFVRDVMTLNGAKPDFGALRRWCEGNEVRGVCLATVQTLTPSVSAQSRFFAPAAGINEDPVTGSVHAPLAAYLVKHRRVPIHDGLAGLMCVQGVPGGRTGVVYALVQIKGDDRYAVRVGGTAHTTMVGQLTA